MQKCDFKLELRCLVWAPVHSDLACPIAARVPGDSTGRLKQTAGSTASCACLFIEGHAYTESCVAVKEGSVLPSQCPHDLLDIAGAVKRWHRAMPGPMHLLNAEVLEGVEDVNEAVKTSERLCLPTSLVCLTRSSDRKPAHTNLLSPWQLHC